MHSAPVSYAGILGTGWSKGRHSTQEEFVAEYMPGQRSLRALCCRSIIAFALFRFAVIFIRLADRAAERDAASARRRRPRTAGERLCDGRARSTSGSGLSERGSAQVGRLLRARKAVRQALYPGTFTGFFF